MNRNIKKALEIALDPNHPVRFHHSIARSGYAEGGLPSPMSAIHDLPYSSGPQLPSRFDVAKITPYTAPEIDMPHVEAPALRKTAAKLPKIKAGKIKIRKPRALKPRKIHFDAGGAAIEDALNLASRTMSHMAKNFSNAEGPIHGGTMSQGSTSTIVKEKVPGKRAHTIYEHHEQTPVEHEEFEMPPSAVFDDENEGRFDRADGGRNYDGVIAPNSSRSYAEDANKWREERGRRGHKKDYDPWADRENMYTHPTEERHDPKDPMYYISPEEYRRGAYGRNTFALANGGRAEMNIGGDPLVGSNPAQDANAIYQQQLDQYNQQKKARDAWVADYSAKQAGQAGGNLFPAANQGPQVMQMPTLAGVQQQLAQKKATTPTVAPATQPITAATPSTMQPTAVATSTSTPYAAPSSDPTANYVSSLYQNVLGRAPEQAGLEAWTNALNQGEFTQGQVLQQFASSPEFQKLYQADPAKAVTALYQEALGRAPEQAGLEAWTNAAKKGMNLAEMTQGFLNSQEGQNVSAISQMYQDYTGTVPTNDQLAQAAQMLSSGAKIGDVENAIANSPASNQRFLTQTYQDLLGRAPTDAEIKQASEQLSSGKTTSENLYNTLQNSAEASNFSNANFIKDEYQGLLGREPTQAELTAALSQLSDGKMSFEDFDKSLANSDASQEYQASNFAPYQVASSGSVTHPTQPRTAYQYSKANDDLIRSLPEWQQMGALLQQEGGMWVKKILDPNTPQSVKEQAMRQLEGIANVVANRAAVGLTDNNGGKGPWNNWFGKNNKNSITDQILAPSAFSAMKIGVSKLARQGYNTIVNEALPLFGSDAYAPIENMIKGVLSNSRPDITNGATHYKANYVHPGWAGGKRGLPFRTDLGGAPGGRGSYHQFYGSGTNAEAAKLARFGAQGQVQVAGGQGYAPGGDQERALIEQLTGAGAGGNVAGSGMSNPGGGAIGGGQTGAILPTDSGALFQPQGTGLPGSGPVSGTGVIPVNTAQISSFDPVMGQQTGLNFDPNTGIGLHSIMYGGPGQINYGGPGSITGFNPFGVTGYVSPNATNFTGTLSFGPPITGGMFRRGGFIAKRALKTIKSEDDISDAIRLAKRVKRT